MSRILRTLVGAALLFVAAVPAQTTLQTTFAHNTLALPGSAIYFDLDVQATPITPFTAKGGLDAEGAAENAARLAADGAAGLVVCGSIGELPSLALEEWEQVVAANAG
ncbi:MAG: dihydrodipicolinate synthase family protein, partial [Planctomycetes bacterium]|nr:dihydrodipicolinate synthase family protein [Planctomycetota bacterium]